jgi:hypothetical protein
MKRLLMAVLASSLLAAASARAQQTGKLQLLQLPPIEQPRQPNRFSYDPASESMLPPRARGARMLVGADVGADAVMGVGLFNSSPRQRPSAEIGPDFEPRKKRDVGLGLLMKF